MRMKSSDQKTMRLRVTFPNRSLARPVLEDLGRDRGLTVNIVRGRITKAEASFELEVTGPARRVDDLIRLGSKWGAAASPLPLVFA